ncbi:Transcriptional regulator, AraC family [gamma proteobacterium HdN1]|nr:Transcriptional regulator, AraC family [gamma proteobacterium HdN1]
MITMKEPFILTSWVNMCLGGFKRDLAIPIPELFRHAEINASFLKQPLFPVEAANALFQSASEMLGNFTIGLEAGRNISPTTFPALGFAAIASENLLEGFRLIADHSHGITDVTRLYVSEQADSYGFGFDPSPDGMNLHEIGYDAALSMVARICRQLQEGPAAIREVDIAHDRPANWQKFEQYFKAPVRWNQPCYCLYFEKEYFLRQNKHADRSLKESSAAMATQYFDGLLETTRTTHVVRRHINQALADSELSLADIAVVLHVSERTLQRQLSQEGTSFRQLMDDVRREAARRHVLERRSSVSEIAFALGFNDSGNFSRAFKRWFGCAPQAYRQRSLQSSF